MIPPQLTPSVITTRYRILRSMVQDFLKSVFSSLAKASGGIIGTISIGGALRGVAVVWIVSKHMTHEREILKPARLRCVEHEQTNS
jgi:hypothetical protein